MGLLNLANGIKIIQGNRLKSLNYLKNNIINLIVDLLTQLNELFKNKGIIFTLNKIQGKTENIK